MRNWVMHCDRNFATEHRFHLNLLLYCKVGHNSIPIIKRHKCYYFDITRKLNYKRTHWTTNGNK